MKNEIRKLISTFIIMFLFWVLPVGEFKNKFASFLTENLIDL